MTNSRSFVSKCIFTISVGIVLIYQLARKNEILNEKNIVPKPISLKSKKKEYPIQNPDSFKGAGIAFTDGKHILSAYHPHKSKRYISGIGGSREGNETYMFTAFREMVEELFEYPNPPKEMIETLIALESPKKESELEKYIILSYSFEFLVHALKHIASYNLPSKLYDEFPLTLTDLILKRKCITPDPELSHLCLLPIVKYMSRQKIMSRDFYEELYIHRD
jgi:hypothetical protein